MPDIGTFSVPSDTMSPLHRNQFQHSDALYAGDVLRQVPGVLIREFGGPGQAEPLSIAGVANNGISLALDGRPLNDPVRHGYNLYDIPMEYVEQIERIDGPRSLLYGASAPGGVLNIVSRQYNSNHPRTKLRFFQGAFEHILTDGMFAQNVSRGLNALVGIQRHVTDGRFTNTAYDSWNVRTRLRYDPSDQLSAWISEGYTKSTIGLNSGVDPGRSPSLYDDLTAVVKDDRSYQISSRHDLTIGFVGTFLGDSTTRTNAILYYSALEREYSVGGGPGAPPQFSDLQESSYWGFRLNQNLRWSIATLVVGAQVEQRSFNQSHFLPTGNEQYSSANAGVTADLTEWLHGNISLRWEKQGAIAAQSWGAGFELNIVPGFSLISQYTASNRFPTIQELFWTDSILKRSGNLSEEHHRVTEAGLRAQSDQAEMSLVGFRRVVDNALTFSQIATPGEARSVEIANSPSVEISGLKGEARLRLWKFSAEGNLTYANYKSGGRSVLQIPRLSSTGEFSFSDSFFNDELDLKVAIRWKAVTSHLGLQFVPRMMVFAQQPRLEMPAFTTVDLYCVARIGNAYLALTLENPLNTKIMLLPYYPLMNRNLKLGVNWEFTD
jgi:outer membrane cobalamin receptor